AAHDGDAQWPPQLRARARAEGKGQTAEEGGHGRHHDGTEAQETGLVDRFRRRLASLALRLQGEGDNNDRVLLNDADEEKYADEGDDAEGRPEELQGEDGPPARRRQGGEN